MRGAVFERVLQLQHHLAGAVTLEPFVGDRRAGDIAAQVLQFLGLIGAPAHRRMEAKAMEFGIGPTWMIYLGSPRFAGSVRGQTAAIVLVRDSPRKTRDKNSVDHGFPVFQLLCADIRPERPGHFDAPRSSDVGVHACTACRLPWWNASRRPLR